ncbi:hypothetical protein E2C01_042893 [Portunus trituberculatus]|uniref:Uncharacterized protein n=1 Tax=Portunus trituberculatus TaxID=210409 RepID=A0A5B7FUU3_PORTR|nr:hypothetical protein [Portunus trituberculatus]
MPEELYAATRSGDPRPSALRPRPHCAPPHSLTSALHPAGVTCLTLGNKLAGTAAAGNEPWVILTQGSVSSSSSDARIAQMMPLIVQGQTGLSAGSRRSVGSEYPTPSGEGNYGYAQRPEVPEGGGMVERTDGDVGGGRDELLLRHRALNDSQRRVADGAR